jgi:hypothetical protein
MRSPGSTSRFTGVTLLSDLALQTALGLTNPGKRAGNAAGLSMSGVRIAYDDDEIARIADITGLRPRQRSQP